MRNDIEGIDYDAAILQKLQNAAERFRAGEIEKLVGKLNKTGGDLLKWLAEQSENLEYGAIAGKFSSMRRP
jgi:hypothetical protein